MATVLLVADVKELKDPRMQLCSLFRSNGTVLEDV